MKISCRGEELVLSNDRAVFWPAQSMLIVSDLHIGKSAHFRKSGIQVPDTIGHTDLQRLTILLKEYDPKILLVTGDMFHNNINSDADAFMEWRRRHSSLRVILIKGNHDALRNEDYKTLSIEVHQRELICNPFRFIHDKPKTFDEYYNITGHVHPGIVLYGRARQRLKFPCFYFGETCAVLPAFSVFTGLAILTPEKGDRFYAITPEKLVELKT